MRKALIVICLILSMSLFSQGLNNFLNNDANTVMGDGIFNMFTNPASFSHLLLPRYYFSMTDLFEIDAFGASFRKDNLQLAFGGVRSQNLRELVFLIKGVSFETLHTGVSFSGIYEEDDLWLDFKYKVNFGLTYFPFTKYFRTSGQLTDLAIALYVENLLKDASLDPAYPFTIGGTLGFFYKKDVLSVFIGLKKAKDQDLAFSFGLSGKLNQEITLNGGVKLDGAALGIEYYYKDMIFALGFNRTNGVSALSWGMHLIPGNTKNVLISEYISLGIKHYRRKDYEKASGYFNKALGISPDNPDALQFIKITKERAGKDREGLINKWSLKIIKLIKNKKYKTARAEYAKLKKRYPQDKSNWKKIETMFPVIKSPSPKKRKAAAGHLEEAQNLLSSGDLIAARDLLQKAASSSPSPEVQKDLKAAFEELAEKVEVKVNVLIASIPPEDSDETLPVLKEILTLDPSNELAKNRIILYYLELGERQYRDEKYVEALELWESILVLDPDNKDALLYIETVRKRIK